MAVDQPERGVRSPYVLRFGLSVPGCLGIYRQPDPGSIPAAALQDGINVRIASGILYARGGQSKINSSAAMQGCVTNMIDVTGDLGVFVYDFNGNSSPTLEFPALNRYGLLTQAYTQEIDANGGLIFDMSADTRRNVIPFQGKLYVFGTDPATTKKGLYVVSFPSGDDSNTTEPAKWALALELPDFNSFTVRTEVTTSGGNSAMYIGTKTTNTVYRWDGVTLTTEKTAVGAGALIMFQYAGDVYAAGTNTLTQRGSTAAWTATFAMPGGITSFVPSTGVEYVNVALICGTDTTAGQRQRVLSFNGTTLTLSYDPGSTQAQFTDLAVGGGLAYVAWARDANTVSLSTFNGTSWAIVYNTIVDSQPRPGALLALGNDLYWWTSNNCQSNPIGSQSAQTGCIFVVFPGFSISSITFILAGVSNSGSGPSTPCPADMNVL